MIPLFLDSETYSEVPIKHGTYRYAAACEVMLVQYALADDVPAVWDRTDGASMPDDLAEALADPEVSIVCHNSMFDRNVLRFGAGIDLPAERWLDTMVLAYLNSLPGKLATLSEIFKLGDDAKHDGGRALIQLFCCPRPKNSTLRRATKHTHPEKWAEFIAYALQDVVALRRLYDALPKWVMSSGEHALWVLDQKINDRGMCVDLELAEGAVRAVSKRQAEVKAEVVDHTDGEVQSATQRDAVLDFIVAEYGINLPDLKKAGVERLLEDPDVPEGMKELLRLRQQASTSSTAKYKALIRSANDDGRLRGTKQFAGAMRTGRWGGRVFQPDNLPRPPMSNALVRSAVKNEKLTELVDRAIAALKLDVADMIFSGADIMALTSTAIRGTIIAPPGKLLAIADLANIEGRAQAWLTGEAWKLQAFRDYDTVVDGKRKGHDLYKLAYAKSFGVPPESVNKDQRQVGKVQELALGYAGGAGAFATFAMAYNIDLDELADKAYDTLPAATLAEAESFADWLVKKKKKPLGMSRRAFVVCDSFKRLWREAHPAISAYWGELEDTVRHAASRPKDVFACGKLTIQRKGAWLRVRLPSGRCLCYPGIEVDENGQISYMGVNQFTKKWERIKSFGGKFFENVCQAFARDVLAYNMPDVEAAGFAIVLTVHDEVVAEVPASWHDAHEELAEIMATPKDWCIDMPLAAEGFSAARYRK